jgi:hypothetical protein
VAALGFDASFIAIPPDGRHLAYGGGASSGAMGPARLLAVLAARATYSLFALIWPALNSSATQ